MGCFICQRNGSSRCEKCEFIGCSPEHMSMHVDPNSGLCFPIKIEYTPSVGRYLTALRDFKEGESIFEEKALVVAPNPLSTLQCLECCSKISKPYACACGHALCENCLHSEKRILHDSKECDLLKALVDQENNHITTDFDRTQQMPNHVYEPIASLRLLMTKWTNPMAFAYITTLMDHDEDRRQDDNGEYWKHSCETVINPLLKAFQACNYDTNFTEVAKVVGIVEINNYEIYNEDGITGFRGLFPLTSLMSHNCAPNCRMVVQKNYPFRGIGKASRNIQKGEEITITYMNLLMPTFMRRKKIRENWYFDCFCIRCKDRTEFGSLVGAIKCIECTNESSFLLPESPLNPNTLWKSDTCPHFLEQENIDEINTKLLKDREIIPRSDLKSLKNFLKKAGAQLHPQHYILSLTKRWMLPVLCHDPVKAVYEEWQEKLQLVKELLQVLNIVNPGYSKDRGRALFELSVTTLNLNKLEYESHKLDLEQFKNISLNTVIPMFQNSIQILNSEPEKSYEQMLCWACNFYIDKLRNI